MSSSATLAPKIAAMMALGIVFTSESRGYHRANYQHIANHCHHRGRGGGSEAQRTHFGSSASAQAHIGDLSEFILGIPSNDYYGNLAVKVLGKRH